MTSQVEVPPITGLTIFFPAREGLNLELYIYIYIYIYIYVLSFGENKLSVKQHSVSVICNFTKICFNEKKKKKMLLNISIFHHMNTPFIFSFVNP